MTYRGSKRKAPVKRKKAHTLRVTSVGYKTNCEVGQYRHKHVEATAEVPRGADPKAVLTSLMAFVHDELILAKAGSAFDFLY